MGSHVQYIWQRLIWRWKCKLEKDGTTKFGIPLCCHVKFPEIADLTERENTTRPESVIECKIKWTIFYKTVNHIDAAWEAKNENTVQELQL